MENNGPGVHPRIFSARLTSTFASKVSGPHQFSLISSGNSRLFIDGRELIDNWTSQQPGESYFGSGSSEVIVETELLAGQHYQL